MTQKRVKAFLQIADEELRQAEYFLQQAVEKLIRATLEAEGVPAGTAHNLSFLAGLLPASHALRARFAEFEHLSSASTRYRYPTGAGSVPTISSEEVAKDLTRVRQLRLDVLEYLRSEGQL